VSDVIKPFNRHDWYWIVGADATRVYSSKACDYVAASDPTFVSWAADGTPPGKTDSEAQLGASLATDQTLRPIPQGVLDGFIDNTLNSITNEPGFAVVVDLYKSVIHPTPTDAQIIARIRAKL
jgi:hypothetical protein